MTHMRDRQLKTHGPLRQWLHGLHQTITTIKMEDGNDEVKIFSASSIKKNEPEDDIDVDGIEDRLSPVVEEPVSTLFSLNQIQFLLYFRQVQIRMSH